MPRQQIVRKIENLEGAFDALIHTLNKILELSERTQTGTVSPEDIELGRLYTEDLIRQITLTKDEIDNMKDFTAQMAEYKGNFLNFLDYEENYLFSSKLLGLIDLQYQKPDSNYLLEYLKQEIEQIRHVQLQFVTRILCLLNFRDIICRATRKQILHLRIVLRSYMELGVILDILPIHSLLGFLRDSPRRVLSLMRTLPRHQYDKLREDYRQAGFAVFVEAPLFLLCMYVVLLQVHGQEAAEKEKEIMALLAQITLTPRHIYLGSAEAFTAQMHPDGLSIVVRPIDAGKEIDGVLEEKYKAWEESYLTLSVRYNVINLSNYLVHLGMSIAKELDPEEAQLQALLRWFYANTDSKSLGSGPGPTEFCIPIGFIDGGTEAVAIEVQKLKSVLTASGLVMTSLNQKFVKRFCAAYEAATAEPCHPSGCNSKLDGVQATVGAHVLSIVFLSTIRTKVYERGSAGVLIFLTIQEISH